MKNLITILLAVLVQSYLFGQLPIDSITGKVVFSDVVKLPDMTKEEIYKKAKLWMVSTLKSGDNMVELEGSNSDNLVGTGNLLLDSIMAKTGIYHESRIENASLNFKIIVFCKDGRFKYSVENFLLTTILFGDRRNYSLTNLSPHYVGSKKYTAEWKLRTEQYLRNVIETLINDFIRSVKTAPEDDW